MPERRIARVGQLGLWVMLLSLRRALLLNNPEFGPFGNPGSNVYLHVCEETGCTAKTFPSPSKGTDFCNRHHPTVAAVVVNGRIPVPAKSAGRYIYTCLVCKGPPERLDQPGSPNCRRHGAMNLLACP
ncbi:hypothetical protein [Streptomyces sp. NPDC056464]|uniref:hypothetical protein n=1 Tax=Streptomyces sp. NPDC056464 TaxID=3345828 RepID=UPI0036C4BAF2